MDNARPVNVQNEKFIATAKEIGCDQDEASFKDRLKKLLSAPAPKANEKQKKKTPSK